MQQPGRGAEGEETLRHAIRMAKDIIAAEPKLIYRRWIIAKALMGLAALSSVAKGISLLQRELFSDARAHVQAGLAINPLDVQLNELRKEFEVSETETHPPQSSGNESLSPS